MKSPPPPDSASFDALWGADEDDSGEKDLPPALAPSLQGTVVPQDDRDTLLPPLPPAEYVQTMMELGELDDPLFVRSGQAQAQRPTPPGMPALHPTQPPRAAPPLAPPRPAPAPGGKAKPLGLVLASERELLLDETPRGGPITVPGTGPRRRSTGRFPAIQPQPHYTPAPFASPRGAAMAVGARAVGAAHALPVPRAPSVPPAAEAASLETLDGLGPTIEGLDALDSLDDLLSNTPGDTPPGPPVRRYTPPALSMPASSKPIPSAPTSSKPIPSAPSSPRRVGGAAGLRLGKRTPMPAAPDDRGSGAPPSPVRWGAPGAGAGEMDRETPVPASNDGGRPSEQAPSSLAARALEMVALFDSQNYSSALVLAESVLLGDPEHAQARRCAAACRERLTEKYLGNLGGRGNIPRVTMGAEEIRWLSLDHRAGFLLSFVDGSMSIDEVLDVSSMPELDALRIMFELRMQGVIEIVEPARRPGRRG